MSVASSEKASSSSLFVYFRFLSPSQRHAAIVRGGPFVPPPPDPGFHFASRRSASHSRETLGTVHGDREIYGKQSRGCCESALSSFERLRWRNARGNVNSNGENVTRMINCRPRRCTPCISFGEVSARYDDAWGFLIADVLNDSIDLSFVRSFYSFRHRFGTISFETDLRYCLAF